MQQAFVEAGAVQCGFCTPGLVVATADLLAPQRRARRDDEIREALSGNLCRCTGYAKIFDAVRLAARAHDARPPAQLAARPRSASSSRASTRPRR